MIEFTPKFSPNSRYMLRDRDEVAYFETNGGAPEAPLIDWALQFVRPEQSFIDVGAHIGTWTQHFAQKCARVVAFEPQRSTFERLRQGLAKATLPPSMHGVTLHNVALGRSGEGRLYITTEDGGGSTLMPHRAMGNPIAIENVDCGELDDYTFYDVGLVKIDAEGMESSIIEGGNWMLREHRPVLLFEAWLHDWYKNDRIRLIETVVNMNYKVQPVAGWPEMLLGTPY